MSFAGVQMNEQICPIKRGALSCVIWLKVSETRHRVDRAKDCRYNRCREKPSARASMALGSLLTEIKMLQIGGVLWNR